MSINKTIYLAGGCFWGVEAYYKNLKGVVDTTVGYANGKMKNPRYEDLKYGMADHAETLKLVYDDNILTIETILEHFLRFVDPYSIDKQAHDIGHQYRSGIYFVDEKEKDIIKNYFDNVLDDNYKIEILPLINFYEAEEYHQDYLDKNPNGYCHVNLNLLKKEERKN